MVQTLETLVAANLKFMGTRTLNLFWNHWEKNFQNTKYIISSRTTKVNSWKDTFSRRRKLRWHNSQRRSIFTYILLHTRCCCSNLSARSDGAYFKCIHTGEFPPRECNFSQMQGCGNGIRTKVIWVGGEKLFRTLNVEVTTCTFDPSTSSGSE